jgi:hypothetical protein
MGEADEGTFDKERLAAHQDDSRYPADDAEENPSVNRSRRNLAPRSTRWRAASNVTTPAGRIGRAAVIR